MLKEATREDIPEIVDVGESIRSEAKGFDLLGYDKDSAGYNLMRLVVSGGNLWVYEVDNKIVGMIAGKIISHFYNNNKVVAHCFFIAVDKEHRGNGYSKEMKNTFEDWAEQKGAEIVSFGGDSAGLDGLMKDEYQAIEKVYIKKI